MITFDDLTNAFKKAKKMKLEAENLLPKEAAVLMDTLCESLGVCRRKYEKFVSAGTFHDGHYRKCPFWRIEISSDRSFNFILCMDFKHSISWSCEPTFFLSISMKKEGEVVKVFVQDNKYPFLVHVDGGDGRYSDSVEGIKLVFMSYIETLG